MNRIFPSACLFAALLAGCARHAPKQVPPPLRVEVAEAAVDSIPYRMRFIGYLASRFEAVIQPRVNGYLSSKQYGDGMPVRRGQLLFTIDPDQLSTSMLAAEAELESARAQELEARNNHDRAVPLARIEAISQSQLDQYTAQWKAAEASVRSAEQALRSARMNVGYTELRSPIDGIVACTKAHVGDYVGPGTQFNVLTSVSNIDTLTVDVAIPMVQYLRHAGPRTSIYDNEGLLSDICLVLADGSTYPLGGVYDYTRRDVSSTTGTLVVVVMFPNPDKSLKPGQFARVEASVGPVLPRVVVPQQAVSRTQNVSSVWVVGPDSTVRYRRVVPGDTYGAMWCIDEGLERGERVVVAGRQKLRDGAKVIPERAESGFETR
ncbi:efflux RND transporter periplasmic adaptor subunit [Alistipes sp.]|uniref:efflux RND transporter periplasmic adaptor subunit n=1 Tax=Alistipes sp. TaxID=1872444 RepID=UPI0025BF0812|nr:efflux RND transporter periplasmic adaptor subunit [Alistipes sp.]